MVHAIHMHDMTCMTHDMTCYGNDMMLIILDGDGA
jgi:hypothetical protein